MEMELDRRLEMHFQLIGSLASYVEDSADREALFRSSGLTSHLASIATTIWDFFAEHGILVRGWRFLDAFKQAFSTDLEVVDSGSNRERARGASEREGWRDSWGNDVGVHPAAGTSQCIQPAAVGTVASGIRRGGDGRSGGLGDGGSSGVRNTYRGSGGGGGGRGSHGSGGNGGGGGSGGGICGGAKSVPGGDGKERGRGRARCNPQWWRRIGRKKRKLFAPTSSGSTTCAVTGTPAETPTAKASSPG